MASRSSIPSCSATSSPRRVSVPLPVTTLALRQHPVSAASRLLPVWDVKRRVGDFTRHSSASAPRLYLRLRRRWTESRRSTEVINIVSWGRIFSSLLFLGATKHLCNWLSPLVGRSVTHSLDDPHIAPYWSTWPCFLSRGPKTVVTF